MVIGWVPGIMLRRRFTTFFRVRRNISTAAISRSSDLSIGSIIRPPQLAGHKDALPTGDLGMSQRRCHDLRPLLDPLSLSPDRKRPTLSATSIHVSKGSRTALSAGSQPRPLGTGQDMIHSLLDIRRSFYSRPERGGSFNGTSPRPPPTSKFLVTRCRAISVSSLPR